MPVITKCSFPPFLKKRQHSSRKSLTKHIRSTTNIINLIICDIINIINLHLLHPLPAFFQFSICLIQKYALYEHQLLSHMTLSFLYPVPLNTFPYYKFALNSLVSFAENVVLHNCMYPDSL